MKLIRVPTERAAQAWPKVSGLIYAAMKKGGLGAFKPIENSVLSGFGTLWLAWDGKKIAAAAVTEIFESEWRKDMMIIAYGGIMADVLQLREDLYIRAKEQGCQSLRIIGRKGWEKMLPDFKVIRIVMEHQI